MLEELVFFEVQKRSEVDCLPPNITCSILAKKKEEAEWMDYFTKKLKEALALQSEIDDREIDEMVYDLYWLSEEKRTVEGNLVLVAVHLRHFASSSRNATSSKEEDTKKANFMFWDKTPNLTFQF